MSLLPPADTAAPACAGGCGSTEALTVWPVEGRPSWLCGGCLVAIIRGPQVASGDAGRPFARAGGR